MIALSDELQEREERVQSEERVDPPLLLQSTMVQECRADYDLKANLTFQISRSSPEYLTDLTLVPLLY